MWSLGEREISVYFHGTSTESMAAHQHAHARRSGNQLRDTCQGARLAVRRALPPGKAFEQSIEVGAPAAARRTLNLAISL
jgi:hypothetical protein